MFRSIIRRFKSTTNLNGKSSADNNAADNNKHYVVLCPKCYFVTSANISVGDYIEMHKNFNNKFVDECPNNFIVTNSKCWKSYENCSALYYPLC